MIDYWPKSTTASDLGLVVQAFIAIGTVGAVVVALFGQAFRSKFFPPKLSLNLVSEIVETTQVWLTPPGVPKNALNVGRGEYARFYHVKVANHRQWSVAKHVQIVLLRVDEQASDGTHMMSWVGDLPLNWRHKEAFPTSRSLGSEATADLCSVIKDKWLDIETAVKPNNLRWRHIAKVVEKNPIDLILTLQARSDEADSGILQVRLCWDGIWAQDDREMQRHLSVKEFTSAGLSRSGQKNKITSET